MGRWAKLLGIFITTFVFTSPSLEASWLSRLLQQLRKRPKPVHTNLMTSPQSMAVFSQGLEDLWRQISPSLRPLLQQQLLNLKGKKWGKLTVEDVKLNYLHWNLGPSLSVSPYVSSTISGQKLQILFPRSPGWEFSLFLKLRYDFVKRIWFFTIRKTFRAGFTIDVKNIQVKQALILDTKDPTWPQIKQIPNPRVNFRILLRTRNAVANFLLRLASPLLTWYLKAQLKKQIQKFMPSFSKMLLNKPAPYGLGGQMGFTRKRPKLLQHALFVDQMIQKYHLPFGTIVSTVFSQPKGGTPVFYAGIGDSAIWTGHYLAGEAFHYHVTKDPKALQNIQRVLRGIETLFDVCRPGDGQLARFAAPLTSSFGQWMRRNKHRMKDYFERPVRGTLYAAIGEISRDQYCGVMLGLMTTHDFVKVPAVQRKCRELILRAVEYFRRNRWAAKRVTPRKQGVPYLTAPLTQTPSQLYNYVLMAYRLDPAKYASLHRRYAPLTSMFWIPSVIGALETHFKYYGFNLAHATYYTLLRLEKNPRRFQEILRAFLILRRAVGHHRNAWFNLIAAAVIPGQRRQWKNIIIDDIRRFALRDLWETAIPRPTATDPSVPKVWYSGLYYTKVGWGLSNKNPKQGYLYQQRVLIAKYPQPVERRPHTDFLWQRSPFTLSTSRSNPRFRNPGVDMVLPYWMARAYGVLK